MSEVLVCRVARSNASQSRALIKQLQEMAGRSARVAGFLTDLGVSAGDRSLVMLPSNIALREVLLGARGPAVQAPV